MNDDYLIKQRKWVSKEEAKEMYPDSNECKSALHDDDIYKIQDMIRQIERLNGNCTDNMKRLNSMMLELKGIIAMVRPMAKKNDWYGEEIDTRREIDQKAMTYLVSNLPLRDSSKD